MVFVDRIQWFLILKRKLDLLSGNYIIVPIQPIFFRNIKLNWLENHKKPFHLKMLLFKFNR